MKPPKLYVLITTVIAALIALSACAAEAQSTNTPPGFFSTAFDWFSSQDTNLTTFSAHKARLETGMAAVQGLTVANTVTLEYPVYRSLCLGFDTENLGIGGPIASQQFRMALRLVKADIEIVPYAGAGLNLQTDRFIASLGLELRKAMSQSTYAFIGIDAGFNETGAVRDMKKITPQIRAGFGVTF